MNEIKTVEATPDQLLKLLDLQLFQARAKRAGKSPARRAIILTTGILLILAACFGAFLILQQMVDELPRPEGKPASTQTAPAGL